MEQQNQLIHNVFTLLLLPEDISLSEVEILKKQGFFVINIQLISLTSKSLQSYAFSSRGQRPEITFFLRAMPHYICSIVEITAQQQHKQLMKCQHAALVMMH